MRIRPGGITASRRDASAHSASLPTMLFTALLGAWATAPIGAARAVDVKYDVGASVLHSDNITLSETDHIGETVLSPQVNFEATQTGAAVQMLVRGNLEYLTTCKTHLTTKSAANSPGTSAGR